MSQSIVFKLNDVELFTGQLVPETPTHTAGGDLASTVSSKPAQQVKKEHSETDFSKKIREINAELEAPRAKAKEFSEKTPLIINERCKAAKTIQAEFAKTFGGPNLPYEETIDLMLDNCDSADKLLASAVLIENPSDAIKDKIAKLQIATQNVKLLAAYWRLGSDISGNLLSSSVEYPFIGKLPIDPKSTSLAPSSLLGGEKQRLSDEDLAAIQKNLEETTNQLTQFKAMTEKFGPNNATTFLDECTLARLEQEAQINDKLAKACEEYGYKGLDNVDRDRLLALKTANLTYRILLPSFSMLGKAIQERMAPRSLLEKADGKVN